MTAIRRSASLPARLHRFCVAFLVGVTLCTLACGRSDPEQWRFERPDIVLVSIDSLRPDHLGCYGYSRSTSPTLDALAEEGIRFAHAISTTSWTLPAHAALFTGLYDSAHGLLSDDLALAEGHSTLAEVFRDGGYHTAGFYGGPYLHPSFGMAQGFETYRSAMTRLSADLSESELREQARSGKGEAHADVTGPRTLERVDEWLGTLDERPVFLFLHLWDVHYDYIPPQRYVDLFDPDYDGTLDATDYLQNRSIHFGMGQRDYEHLVALYDGEIRFTDDILSEILQRLDARGRMENTIVVVTADHGDEFFEHGSKGHRQTLFDEVVRVPLILRLPQGVSGGRVVDSQVRVIDVMPTLVSLAGLSLPSAVQGRDLTPLLRGESMPPTEALSELERASRVVRALRTDREKLIRDTRYGRVLFDLKRDPAEIHPLPLDDPRFDAVKQRLRSTVTESRELREQLGAAAVPSAPSPELQRRLEALGYVDPGTE